jgi:hypothetical protein
MSGILDGTDRDDTPLGVLRQFAAEIAAVVGMASRLAGSGVAVDLNGLDRQVGLLCAKTLDLPPDQGRQMLPCLTSLLAGTDLLTGELADRGG